ncbi:hypothetical protein JHK84_043156 [Glycine max]|nr:hypothetical protein JHK86_042959 [Glycine max]KAG5117043.1 hypothetical protein JHK84_043156 [Glycine max]
MLNFLTSILCFTLTYSFLIFTLRFRVLYLEVVARIVVWHESCDTIVLFLCTRALFTLLSFPLSLTAAVHATVIAVFVYVILTAFALVPRVFAATTFTSTPWIQILVRAITSGTEVYMMTKAQQCFRNRNGM